MSLHRNGITKKSLHHLRSFFTGSIKVEATNVFVKTQRTTAALKQYPLIAHRVGNNVKNLFLFQVREKLGGWREGGSAKEEETAEAEAGRQPVHGQLLQLLRHPGILPHPGQEQEQGEGGQQGRLPQHLQNSLGFRGNESLMSAWNDSFYAIQWSQRCFPCFFQTSSPGISLRPEHTNQLPITPHLK